MIHERVGPSATRPCTAHPDTAPWMQIAKVCVALALASLLFNVTSQRELGGDLQAYSFVRKSITKVLNSGTVWAGVAFYAGWKVARPMLAFLSGIGAAVVTLLIHYLAGSVLRIYEPGMLMNNAMWFLAALVLCGPLGLAGWLAARCGSWSLLARLVIPAGAIAEPLVLGRFQSISPRLPWAEQWSDAVSGAVLIVGGVVGACWVLSRGRSSALSRRTEPVGK